MIREVPADYRNKINGNYSTNRQEYMNSSTVRRILNKKCNPEGKMENKIRKIPSEN